MWRLNERGSAPGAVEAIEKTTRTKSIRRGMAGYRWGKRNRFVFGRFGGDCIMAGKWLFVICYLPILDMR